MNDSHVKIQTHGNKFEVWIDGQKIPGLRKVEFSQEFQDAALLKLELIINGKIEIIN